MAGGRNPLVGALNPDDYDGPSVNDLINSFGLTPQQVEQLKKAIAAEQAAQINRIVEHEIAARFLGECPNCVGN